MARATKVLVFAGSARTGSLNKKLARVAVDALREAGGEPTLLDLADYPMPIYEGDLEAREGVPRAARELREIFRAHPALLVVSPENNASVPALLKNTIDWLSRPTGGENGLVPYQGKVAALMAASPGALGGMRGLVHLRQILQALNVLVIPEQFALPRAHEAFDAAGALADAKQQATVNGIARRLVEVAARLAPS
ncbi:MAG: NAD(P)H-dependent oxidoreductase [Burkholderiales bacterium]|nr:NAD(P)H-dependent oxidoreductase [Burkholderiales bacterium]